MGYFLVIRLGGAGMTIDLQRNFEPRGGGTKSTSNGLLRRLGRKRPKASLTSKNDLTKNLLAYSYRENPTHRLGNLKSSCALTVRPAKPTAFTILSSMGVVPHKGTVMAGDDATQTNSKELPFPNGMATSGTFALRLDGTKTFPTDCSLESRGCVSSGALNTH